LRLKFIVEAAALSLKRPPYGAPTALRTSFLPFGHRAGGTLGTPGFSAERNGRDLRENVLIELETALNFKGFRWWSDRN
jgi:hypothetical protein